MENKNPKHVTVRQPNVITLPLQKAKQPKQLGLAPVVPAQVVSSVRINRNTRHTARTALEQYRMDCMGMLAHDITDPLMAILESSDSLIEGVKNRGYATEEDYLGRLRSNALTIRSVVANHLDMARIESGTLKLEREPLSINELVSRVAKQYNSEAARQQIRLVFQLQDSLPAVEGDPLALGRVFGNLLANALNFTLEDGQVSLQSNRQDEEVHVTIADTGVGISTGELTTIFDKSERLRVSRKQEGTGLGLFIVKTLVEAQGGRVSVESTLRKGTRFTVSLPIVQAEP